jgi:serine/threonine protein kinase
MDPEIAERAKRRVGTTIRDKYRIDSVLGIGGMAVVYRATHRNLAEFAIKMLHPELSLRESLRQRFLREGYAANSVKHPGVVAIVDDDVAEDGAAFLVMELLDGTSVHALAKANGRRLPIPTACGVLDQLLDVLAAAHEKGIVHRDVKPGNMFLTKDGTLKVLDFGIARVRDAMSSDDASVTGTGVLLGTPGFMAPEQAKGEQNRIDARTDLWAAGATFFTLVSGKLVHSGENSTQLMIAAATSMARSVETVAPVPAPIARVIDRALDFDRDSRWSSAADMQRALRAATAEAFGSLPSRPALAAWLTADPSSPAAADPTPPLAQSVQTAQPVSATTILPQTTTPPKSGGWTLQILAVAVIVVAFAVGVNVLARSVSSSNHAPSAVPVAASYYTPPPEPTPSSEPAAPVTAAPVEEPAVVAHTRPHHVVTVHKPPPTPHTRPHAATLTNCDPPYYFDSDNNKIFKKECL